MTATASTGTECSDEFASAGLGEGEGLPAGIGPWRLAWRRLRRNKTALFFGGLFLVILVLCLLAPVYAHDVAHIGAATENIAGQGNKCPPTCVSVTGIPVGPTWTAKYFFGADRNGRDVAVRLLYGGRNSLEIGAVATPITMVLALIIGALSGYFRGILDGFINRALDVVWAYPAVLLGVALGTVLAVGGIGPLHGTSLLVPAVV